MLAVFDRYVAQAPPELNAPGTDSPDCRKKGVDLVDAFKTSYPKCVTVHPKDACAIGYSHERQALLRPRSFAVVDEIFCVFEGMLENLPALRQQYGLLKTVSEVILVIEAYRVLRDRAPFRAHQVLRDLRGQFAFVLFDAKTSNILVSLDCQGKVPLFWGTTSDGSLSFSDDPQLLKAGCGKSFAPFPQGFFFSSAEGLQSFEHPLNEVKAMPRVDSQGQMCGATFKVDPEKKVSSRSNSGNKTSWAAAAF
ncbi:hypothetical protein O6H91_05G022000 [Diphasiastrum complanatum]|uniref:Uncharacterized protein n=1 Tax=Diphasiastrum complanatum TaxID=34168 RepID=A0ACC2DLB6_DIPCM|nr:hypothetical protein O6H91_05G022000 [Diphasiastrum complanatum]